MGAENETIARAIKVILEGELPGALDAVEAEWAAIQALTLPDPVSYFLGYSPTIIEQLATAFPFVSIFMPDRTPGDRTEWGSQTVTYLAVVDFWVVADDEATVNLVSMRYAQSIVSVLQAHSVIAKHNQINFEPRLMLTFPATRQLIGGTTGDAYNIEEVDYIQRGRFEILLS